MRHPLPLTLACAALACLLAACGQTGPLYMPDEGVTTPVEIRTAPVQPAGPAAPVPPGAGEPATSAGPAAQEPAAPKKDEGDDAPPPDAGT
jgi:predicted small lipoprotein YifL